MSLEKVLSILSKLPNDGEKIENREEIFSGIKEAVQELSKEKGKLGADILEIKKQLAEVSSKNKTLEDKDSSYQEFMSQMKKIGIDAAEADKLADKLKYQKTIEDEKKQLSDLLKEKSEKLKSLEETERVRTLQDKLTPIFEDAKSKFKDKDGKEVKLHDRFINKESLFKDIDVDNEALVTDRISKVLEEAHNTQLEVWNTFQDSTPDVHKVNTNGVRHFNGEQKFNMTEARENIKKGHGRIDKVAEHIGGLESLNDI